jgi:hypothetical protein
MMGGASKWIILRTGSGRTLALVKSLTAAGYEAWSPSRTIKRPAPGSRRRYVMGQRRVMQEVAQPIIPGIVFAQASRVEDLFRAASLPFGPHPAFSVFTWAGRVPLVTERHIEGLRAEQAKADAAIAAEREAETREAARLERAQRLGSERARRKAMRQQVRELTPGQEVTVADAPAFAGSVGTVVSSTGTAAMIHFGGSLTIKVEAWLVQPVGVQNGNTITGAAA